LRRLGRKRRDLSLPHRLQQSLGLFGLLTSSVETSIYRLRFMMVSSPEGSLTPGGSFSHGSESGVHHQAHGPIRLGELGVVGGAATRNTAENVRVRNCLVARPLDNGGVNVPITLKLQPFTSHPKTHAQVLSDRRDSLKITFEEPAVIGVHCVKGLTYLTQSARPAYTKDLKRVPEMVPCKGTADET
jgi:hypothetical protein